MKLPISSEQLKKYLIEENLATEERFSALEEEAQRKNQSLVDLLVSEKIADLPYLFRIFSESLGVEIANLGSRDVKTEVVMLLDEDIAREKEAIVFNREESGILDVALSDPSDLSTLQFLAQHLKAKIRPFLATPDDLKKGFSIYGSKLTSNFKTLIETNIQESLRSKDKTAEEAAAELPIVAAVENILSYASSSRASDIHIEALEENTMVRYRVDGILFEILRLPKSVHPALVARVKILGGLKLDEHFQPQDGRFRYKVANQVVDIRVAVMPTYHGEKIVMRLLEAAQKPLSFEEIGMLPQVASRVSDNLKKAYGMVLICGPTGSGKTTTLYAIMNILNRPEVNVATIEDPIEYNMRYVNQSQVNIDAGITFAGGLRALLRQDPNIIMVGEIRDSETANISVQAALTGHLLLSSLHTNDAPTAIPRLFDLGVPPFLANSTLNIIVAQRLVRKICQSCIYSYSPDAEFEKHVKEQFEKLNIEGVNYKLPKTLYRGKGCASCGGTGYRERLGIFEVLEITDPMRKIIASPQFSLEAIKAEARKDNMESMFEDGLKKVELALTTIEEVMRVIRE